MRTLLHSCVKVHELIELSFGVVCGIGGGMGILDGGPRAARVRAVLVFWLHWFEWHFYRMFKTEMYSTPA